MKYAARALLPLALTIADNAWGFQPLVTDDTGTQGSGGNQLEAAWAYGHQRVGGQTMYTHSVPLVYTRGLTDSLDLALTLPWQRSNASGIYKSDFTNPAIAMKWRFYGRDNGASLAFVPEIVIPVSAKKSAYGLGDHGTAYNATLIYSQPTSFGEFHLNAGLEHFDDQVEGGANANSWHLSAAPVWRLNASIVLALDVGLDHEIVNNSGSDTSHYALLGLVYSPNQDLDLALGLQKTYSVPGSGDFWMSTLGLTWHFK